MFSNSPNCGVRPMPGKLSKFSPRPSKPGAPSAHMSPAETAWAPAPSRPWPFRWYQTMASSGTPM